MFSTTTARQLHDKCVTEHFKLGEYMKDLLASGFLSALWSVNRSNSAINLDSQTVLLPLWKKSFVRPIHHVIYMKIHFLPNSCRLNVSTLVLCADICCRNLSSPPEQPHLDHMTMNFSRVLSLVLPEGLWDSRDHVSITTSNRLCLYLVRSY